MRVAPIVFFLLLDQAREQNERQSFKDLPHSLPQYPGRGYHNWGRPLPPHPQALWARRSSWNSLGRCHPCSSSSPSASPAFTSTSVRPFFEYGLADFGGVVGGSLRIRGPRASSPRRHLHSIHTDEEESLLSPPASHSLHPPCTLLPGHFVPRRDRRALSLELPHLLQVPALPSHHLLPPVAFHVHHRQKSFSGGVELSGGGGLGSLSGDLHQDCNGKTPLSQLLQPRPRHSSEQAEILNQQSHLVTDVFPQVNARIKNQEDLDDDLDYVRSLKLHVGGITKRLWKKEKFHFRVGTLKMPTISGINNYKNFYTRSNLRLCCTRFSSTL